MRPIELYFALQWGRGFSAAEITSEASGADTLALLQWGRGFSAAEMYLGRQIYPVLCASMGPRLFSRGNGVQGFLRAAGGVLLQWGRGFSAAEISAHDRDRSGGDLASMGPRLFSRGNARELSRVLPGRGCFNGAAAFQPRKCPSSSSPGSGRSLLQWGRGFSAAEMAGDELASHVVTLASMGPRLFSRGNGRLHHGRVPAGVASMGPRLFSRGNIGRGQTALLIRGMLQWGRGFSAAEMPSGSVSYALTRSRFNGAAAFQPRKCGPFLAVSVTITQASMGPRLFSRGNPGRSRTPSAAFRLQWGRGFSAAEIARARQLSAADDDASMGPRLFSRGNTAIVSASDSLDWLQWGRGFSAAEIPCLAERPRQNYKLQWGRGFSAAEMVADFSVGRMAFSLQWGRGFSAAEIRSTRPASGERATASMGPRLFSRGNPARWRLHRLS